MLKPPRNLSKARILISNDDGVHAEGIKVLAEIAGSLCPDVWVVAPELEQSGASHSLTIHRPLRVRNLAERRIAVDGTPTDCVMVAVGSVLHEHKPDLVLSGINHGDNSGDDVTYSGTIAAAIEATLLGVPAVAFSQERNFDNDTVNWEVARKWLPGVLQRLVHFKWQNNVLMNVNFPDRDPDDIKGIKIVPHGKRKIGDNIDERVDPRGRSYLWIGYERNMEGAPPAGTDLEALEQGYITITPLCLDLTHEPTLKELEKAFR